MERKVDGFRDTHGPINVISTGDSMPVPSMQADVKGRPEPCFMSFVIKKLRAKILDIQSNNKAKVLKNELKEKKAEFLNKRDALIRREATTSAASMIQTKTTSLQTRYGTLKGANATAEQLATMEVQIIAMSNTIKLIEGDDKVAVMKIAVESIERDINLLESKLSCSLHYMSFFENMMKQLANGCTLLLSPAFYAPEEGRTNRADFYSDCVAYGEPLAATNAIGVYMLPCGHKYHGMRFATTLVSKQVCVQLGCNERITETVKFMLVGHNPRASPYFQEPTVSNVKTKVSGWFDAEAEHHMSFEIGCGYTENAIGVEEGNVFDIGIASPGGAEKSWSDYKATKNVGHDTVPPESIVLGATSEEGVEAILSGDTNAKSVFLVEFVKRFKSNKRPATTTAPGEGEMIDVFGMCVACGELLESAGVVGTFIVECQHQYYLHCFSALLLSKDHCAKLGCSMVILKVAKSWVGRHRGVKSKYVCVLQIICLLTLNVRLFASMCYLSLFLQRKRMLQWPEPNGKNGQAVKDGPDAIKFDATHAWEEDEDTTQIRDVLQELKHGGVEGKGIEKGQHLVS
ncbi:hypothetical protein L7F22_046758 [Adiantum nelumboides]|nr:hypothetical protein [Adiantum nelumboides]